MPHGTGMRFAWAGVLLGSCSTRSSRSLIARATGQPDTPLGPRGATQTVVASGSAGTDTSTGSTPSTFGPAKLTLTLLPRRAAIGMGAVAQGNSPTRSRYQKSGPPRHIVSRISSR
jgi:hypothetical protein